MNFTPKDYMDFGASALNVIGFLYIVYTFVKDLKPVLKKMELNAGLSNEVIRNNTEAFTEMAKSNDNVAKSLELLQTALSPILNELREHDARSAKTHELIIQMDVRTQSCLNKK